MRTKLLLGATLLLGLQLTAQQLSEPKPISLKDAYTNPLISPDGNNVLLTKEHYKGVYLLNLKTKKVETISISEGSGYAYSWNQNSSIFYFKEKGKAQYFKDASVKSYNIKTKKKVFEKTITNEILASYKGNTKQNIVVYTNLSTLKIEAKDLMTSKTWVVTNDDGQYYNALLSNDGKKVAVHKGADIYVYDINGKDSGKRIGTGLANSWSSDGKYLIGFLDQSTDGHTLSNSELLLFDVEHFKTIQLTDSKDKFEMFPSFYGENKLLFSDEKTGKIFTSTLKF
ncbi:hypothetical protein LZZ90_11230 [Flavobacterium sp. SM15]|uniref:TolB family protein n=1 Tax=Flavobacterium sp. SM15 TaxID=2908005 RepID=UPI001EDA5B59|nr:hypothetical protein [Flavobacterium sp. SM15]MCG2612080.1 hypothetical protein [Flavobacterium sp. SM15]